MMNTYKLQSNIPISNYLRSIGLNPVQKLGGQLSYIPPYRKESKPSLWVNDSKKIWYDKGEGVGGNIVDLAAKINGFSTSEAVKHINFKIRKNPSSIQKVKSVVEENVNLISVKPLNKNKVILHLLKSRGILTEALQSDKIFEVYYDKRKKGNVKRCFGAGWLNNKGGFEVLTKHDSLCLSSKSFTIINNSKKLSSSISIFDSMIDYLSAIKLGWLTSSVQNILILNSHLPTNEVIHFLKRVSADTVYLYLPNNERGEKLYKRFSSLVLYFPSKIYQVDYRIKYSGFETVNDFLLQNPRRNSEYTK